MADYLASAERLGTAIEGEIGMIGVFDSGSGGLTVLRALVDHIPGQRFVYLGDHEHAPYGTRDPEEVYDLTRRNVEQLFQLGCSLVVLACNTAAAVALRRLQQTWLLQNYPDRRVLGVLVPMVEAVTEVPWHVSHRTKPQAGPRGRVGIFATPATVASGAYSREIGSRAPGVTVVQQACPSLVPLIEAGAESKDITERVKHYSAALLSQAGEAGLDHVILGCTHYPLVESVFREILPNQIKILNQPDFVAKSLHNYLARHPQHLEAEPGRQSRIVAFSTTDAPQIRRLGQRFFGAPLAFGRIGAVELATNLEDSFEGERAAATA